MDGVTVTIRDGRSMKRIVAQFKREARGWGGGGEGVGRGGRGRDNRTKGDRSGGRHA